MVNYARLNFTLLTKGGDASTGVNTLQSMLIISVLLGALFFCWWEYACSLGHGECVI